MGKIRIGFRKSIKIAPGVRLNVGKKSVGMSFGVKGLRYSVNSKRGARITTSIPGTGISFSQQLSSSGGATKRGIGCSTLFTLLIGVPFVAILIANTYNNANATAQRTLSNPVNMIFTSDPAGSSLIVNGEAKGVTPATVQVESGELFSYALTAPEPYDYNLFKPYSGSYTPTKDEALSIWIERTTAEEQQTQINALNGKRQQETAPTRTFTSSYSSSGCGPGETYVNGYYRKNGTYVNSHCRSR